MSIDYDDASITYDSTRSIDERLLELWRRRINLANGTKVLDFGCGTGNYLAALQERFGCECFGVEPAAGMRSKALAKEATLDIRPGDHTQIPFDNTSFDFIFMTDVVHHVPDLGAMFAELRRVLRPAGHLCIVTESHAQIKARFYNRYFPSLAENECRRYPSLTEIAQAASSVGFDNAEFEMLPHGERVIDAAFVSNVAEKNYSMFRLLGDGEYEAGLAAVHADLGQVFPPNGAGVTLVWFSGF